MNGTSCRRKSVGAKPLCGTDQRLRDEFRSTGRQGAGGCMSVRHDRCVCPRRSARCQKRGVRSSQELGVTKLGTDGPARRSRFLTPAWWTGPPPIPRRGPPRATNRMTRPPRRRPRRKLLADSGSEPGVNAGPLFQGTGRSNDPARLLGVLEDPLDDRRHSRQNQLTSHRTPDPNVDVPCFNHSSVKSGSLSFMR